jgi:hypothetical protein
MPDLPCPFCGHPIPLESSLCPHCARPSLYPNVRAAEQDTEREALAARYQAAVEDAKRRGCSDVLRAFETAAAATQAVLSRPFADVERLASSERQLLPTYYQLLEAEARLPYGDRWDKLRRLADAALFPGYEKSIRFAALATDGSGLPSYGECSLLLREGMIAHRASVFEDNSALVMERWAYNSPGGFRAAWHERTLLCVAKLADQLRPESKESEFAALLLRPGAVPEDDRFIEVHIWGPMSGWTLERVVLTSIPSRRRPPRTAVKQLRAQLAKFGVALEER